MKKTMTFCSWDKSMSVGSAELDSQHQYMVSIINEVYDAYISNAPAREIAGIIDKLRQYMVYHFTMEEVYFEMFNFYDRENHVNEHAMFKQKVDEFISRYKSGDANLTCDILNFLKEWLADHIFEADMKYVDCFTKNKVK